jgi:hypothetical protein
MDTDKLQHYLESRRNDLSEKEFLALIFEMLEKDPLEEERDILRGWLLACSRVDEDRVARYWESFLSHPDPFQREVAALQLSMLDIEPNSLADRILTNYLGEESRNASEDEKLDFIMRRFHKLFPSQEDEEN